ncbi:glycosyltransferase family 39 protein [Nibricoccus sp. IMCC34717]|uniref:glycosyltransferase family 39 protein n=1 Tax=Nibricoccus sp. IMCC34717 TaxID=3034021 RepID=UPI0038504422
MSGAAMRSETVDTREPSLARDLAWLVPLLLVFFFALLGSRPFSNPDEGRYTEIPRAMAESGDYVTPRLNGVKYFEKPPLQYWLSALTFEVAGVNEWTSRAWIALLAAGGAVATYLGGRFLYGRRTGLIAAFLLSTTLLYYAMSRVVILDMAVSVFITTALLSFVAALEFPDGPRRRLLWYGFYASMALATLSKGLIGIVLPGAVAFFWVLLLNQWSRLRPFYPWTGSLVLLAIAAPWHVLASLRNHDFAQFYFVHEHFQRFFSRVHDRYEPIWFFLPVLVGGLLPWVFFAPAAVRLALAGGWQARRENRTAWFLVLWIAVIVLFFSKSQSKLIPYILPVFPACAILLARPLAQTWSGTVPRGVRSGFLAVAAFFVLFAVALVVYPVPRATPEMVAALAPFRIALPIFLLVAAWLMVWRMRKGNLPGAFLSACVCFALFLVTVNPLGQILDTRSSKSLMLQLKPLLKEGDAVYSVGDYAQDMPVYLNRLVSLVDYEGELAFGIAAEPGITRDRFLSRDEFLRRWALPQRAYALLRSDEHVEWFTELPNVRSRVIGRTSRFVLLSNE